MEKHLSVIFVCKANSCRSPMAQFIMENSFNEKKKWKIDSSGTGQCDWYNYKNKSPDYRVLKVIKKKYSDKYKNFNHKGRLLKKEDFENFQYILCMDKNNLLYAKSLFNKESLLNKELSKSKPIIKLLSEYSESKIDIFDPWYYSDEKFEDCFNIIFDCIKNFVKNVENM